MSWKTKQAIERRWRQGYFPWAIAEDLRLTEAQVTNYLIESGKHPLTVYQARARRRPAVN